MKKVMQFVPALLIAVSIVVLGFCLKAGFDALAFHDREVYLQSKSYDKIVDLAINHETKLKHNPRPFNQFNLLSAFR